MDDEEELVMDDMKKDTKTFKKQLTKMAPMVAKPSKISAKTKLSKTFGPMGVEDGSGLRSTSLKQHKLAGLMDSATPHRTQSKYTHGSGLEFGGSMQD